jgi:hypothetical protein
MNYVLNKLRPPRYIKKKKKVKAVTKKEVCAPTTEPSDSTTEFHFHNRFHIGDNLLNLKFFLYISPILKEQNITIVYYYNKKWPYNKEETLQSYLDPDVVKIRPSYERSSLNEKSRNSMELWMGNSIDDVVYTDTEIYFDLYYKKILSHLNIVNPALSTSLWIDEPFLLQVYDTLEPQYKNIDILILNTIGRSAQCDDTSDLTLLALHLSKRFTIVTADPVDGIPSADTLTLQQIGAISTHAKYIISTCSGPQIPCFNKYAKEYVKKWFFFTSGINFVFNSIDYLHTVMDTRPIQKYFDALSSLHRKSVYRTHSEAGSL